jgi:Tfp pilus assembly protein PilX
VGYYGDLVARPARIRADTNAAVSEAEFWANWFGGAGAPDWQDATAVKTYPTTAATALPIVKQQPRYVIELLPLNYSGLPKTVNSGVTGTGTSTIHDYLITARGVGRTDSAVVILQSLYRHSTVPTP